MARFSNIFGCFSESGTRDTRKYACDGDVCMPRPPGENIRKVERQKLGISIPFLLTGLKRRRAKRGRGPLVARTVAVTLIVVLGSVAYNFTSVKNRLHESSSINPTDQVLMANHLLEASLLGFSLFLAMLIDRFHYYMKELELLRTSFDSAKKHPRVGATSE